MKHLTRILSFLLLLFAFQLQAQSIDPLSDTITWTATSHRNLDTNDTFTHTSTFVSYGANKVEIVNGESVKTFTVTSIEGEWPDANLSGSILFHVDFSGLEGAITLANTDQGLQLTLDMSVSSPTGIHNQYFVDHISVN